MHRTLFAIALCAVMAAGCGGQAHTLQKGIDRYNRADYDGALGQFSSVKSGALKDRGLANYLVYRGLTEYHLGQRDEALLSLRRGKEVYSRGSPSWLSPQIAGEMDAALADLADKAASSTPTAPSTDSAPPVAPPPTTGEALVPVKTATPTKTATATATPVKTAPTTTAAAPTKTSAPPTKTLSSSQSTSPK